MRWHLYLLQTFPRFPIIKCSVLYLEEYINFEISFGGKKCDFISLYRSSSQSYDTFETFANNLELNLDMIANKDPYLIVILGDLNAKS